MLNRELGFDNIRILFLHFGVLNDFLLLHQVINGLYRIVNDGILIDELLLTGNGTFDFKLDFPQEGSGFAVHCLVPDKSLEP